MNAIRGFTLVFIFTFPVELFSEPNNNCLNRLAAFPKPDFNTSFILRSQRGLKSFKEIPHDLGREPFYARVYAKPKSGVNQGFCFNGVGVNQVDSSQTSYGGLLYAYNSEYIRVWAPSQPNGHIIFIKDGWGGEKNSQQADEAVVVVEMWASGPEPNFQIDTVIGNGTKRGSFGEVDHQLRQMPDRVLVRFSPENIVNSKDNPNGGFWFHAVSFSQNSNPNGSYGGVIFAYNERIIRLWAPDIGISNTGCILIDRGWGGGAYTQRETRCRIHVKVWVNMLPVPSFQTNWFHFQAQRGSSSFKEIKHSLNSLPELVIVQAQATEGINYHFTFEAQGSVQSGDNSDTGYGGITFAYNDKHVRLWAPSRKDNSKNGYALLIKNGWGDSRFLQKGAIDVRVRVLVYGSKCTPFVKTTFSNNTCIRTDYETYFWLTSPWSKCSSICNQGQKQRHSTGCRVTSKKLIPKGSCDFEQGMCGWRTSPLTKILMNWKRTNGTTNKLNSGPMWGYPRGSFYVYTNSDGVVPLGRGWLESPTIPGASRCHLSFYWNMYGADIGVFSVEVSTAVWGEWKETGWRMKSSQGPIYWRSAYIDLEHYSKIYGIRFLHVLPERPESCKTCKLNCAECKVCPGGTCELANVAVDNIQLWCEAAFNETATSLCQSKSAPQIGCAQTAVIKFPSLKGPAYSEEVVLYNLQRGTATFVKAVGVKNDIIGIYHVNIHYAAEYSLWLSVYNTNESNNAVSFRIDNGDWHKFGTAKKLGHHLWVNYRQKVFLLMPGVHAITLRQAKRHFRFDKISLSPVQLPSWVDLGLQSRLIPDSYLSSNNPAGSVPKPKFGRLNSPEAWCSTESNIYHVFFSIKLPRLAIVSRIALQGGKDIYQKSNDYWITSYQLKTSIDDGSLGFFTWYRDRAGRRVFKGNNDSFGVFEDELPFAVPMRAARIYPISYVNWICLRVELYGVYLSSSACTSSGPELSTTKPCTGDRDCGKNAKCQPKSSGIIKQKFGNVWRRFYSNDSVQEYCTCDPGYHGASCQHYGCTVNPCQNQGTCIEKGKNGSFHCSCPSGFYGNTCQESCPFGRYGYNCSKQCHCNGHGSCDIVTGKCHCLPGFNGSNCQYKCHSGYYGYNCAQRCQCQNGAVCDKVTGACNCSLGWAGKFCDQQCPWNTWGEGCSQNCSCSRSALMCNRKTGECVCDRGYHGRYCANKCPVGTYGWNCSQTCHCAVNSSCSGIDGSCTCTQPGMTGVLCKQTCRQGFYGVGCQQKCLCKNGADCDSATGKCSCRGGWQGQYCDTPCPKGSWGHKCSFKCSCVNGAMCDTVTGQCSCQAAAGCVCDAGWSGGDCSVPCRDEKWGIGCSRTCLCKNGGICNPVNGSCTCLPGFQGLHCDKPCSPGFYGVNCSLPCNCNSSTSNSCDARTGACKCLSGWQGFKCVIPCSVGSWGLDCNQSCRCVHGSCDPVSGTCTCNRGWKGQLCDQPCSNCSAPCPKCHHSNGKCNLSSGKCSCYAGYRGDACLESCPSGYYGPGCRHTCLCVNGVCMPGDGSCDCRPGWTGSKCDKLCPTGRFGYNCSQHCACANGTCNPHNGSCSCPPGYHGTRCRKACGNGWYGAGCRLQCNCSSNGRCDHVTGQCSCSSGWMGRRCDARCKPGYYGVQCSAKCRCSNCNPITGTCRCPPGWQGQTCSQSCPSGYYGSNCSQACQCGNNGTCNHIDGSCTCQPGWTGPLCTDHCPAGRFGMLCSSPCNCGVNVTDSLRPCHHITGKCNCKPGFQGLRCLERCKPGYYGKNCRHKCQCLNNGVCDVMDGSCVCPPGYHGNLCEKTCPRGLYGVNCNSTCECTTSNTRTCNRVDGSCSCLDGYTGVLCENRCPQGSFGAGCHGNCTCRNGAHCDHRTGGCTCTDGYQGKDCSQVCDEGTFGPGCSRKCLCENGAKCDRFTGDCTCAPGYKGLRCSDACLEGRYGVNCVNICDCNPSHTERCDHRDGTCHCMPGYTHRRCDKECKDGFYGQDCKMYCPTCSRHVSGSCNKQYGNCTCTPGYHGYQCYDDCPLNVFGLHCKEKCSCRKGLLCHHVDGTCLNYEHGLFSVVVKETLGMFDDVDSLRDLRIGIEKIMFTYFDKYSSLPELEDGSVASQVKAKASSLEAVTDASLNQSQTTPRPAVLQANQSQTTPRPALLQANQSQTTPRPAVLQAKHDFVVRITSIGSVLLAKDVEATRVVCVLLDNGTVVNSTSVMAVLQRVSNSEISESIAAEYYTGTLYDPVKPSKLQVHLPLIIGVTIGTVLIIGILVMLKLRYNHIKRGYPKYLKDKKNQPEFELQPCLSQVSSHLLAFDNPYYDVLAAMGIDDDIEEEYSNPLYDDVSLYSDSYTSSTDDSCNKDLAHMVVT